jgi:hypothetical protein
MTVRRSGVASLLLTAILCANAAPAAAAGQPPAKTPDPAERPGTSLAEKIACVYLMVGGSIMLYYGPKEREGGQLTMDGKSEAVGGAIAIGISLALLHDIVKKSPRRHRP